MNDWILSVIILLVPIGYFLWKISLFLWTRRVDVDFFIRFIHKHPAKASLYVVRNGEILASMQKDQLMPLASTVKIMVAIEYAQQAASGAINPHDWIPLQEIERFYIQGVDGNAHSEWVQAMRDQNLIQDEKVTLEEIAKGMIEFSSNANTEYLMMRLTFDRINQNIRTLGLSKHQELYPIVSKLLIPYELLKKCPPDLPRQQAVKRVKEMLHHMPLSEFIAAAMEIHEKLKHDLDHSYQQEADLRSWYNDDFDKINSERLVASTTEEYVSILQKVNSGTYFEETVQEHLERLLGWIMNNPANQSWLEKAGGKGGSTAYILTYAIYATDKQNNQTEIAIFFNNLKGYEYAKLSASMNECMLQLLKDEAFRHKVKHLFQRSAS